MEKKAASKKKRTIIILCVVAALVIAGVLYAVFKPEKKLEVETVNASKQTIDETLDTTGTVSPQSEGSFKLIDGAKVVAVNVKVGDTVEAGDVIATFDTSSLEAALNDKEEQYEKAQAAYNNALKTSSQAKTKVDEVKKQISQLEKQIADIEAKSKTTTTAQKTTTAAKESVKVSDSLVNRFMKIAKLFGVEYTQAQAKTVLTNILSSGGSVNDLSSLMDNLGTIAGSSGSFDMSSFAAMSGMAGSSTMSAEMSLVQLKAQLATLELQSGSTYVSTFKTIADKAKTAYADAQTKIQNMKKGWTAEDKGIISEVNITAGQVAVSKNASGTDVDLSSIPSFSAPRKPFAAQFFLQ